MKTLLTILILILALAANGQEHPELADRWKGIDSLYTNGFEGYQADFRNQLFYPEEIKQEKITGTVYFEATIDTAGNILNIEVIRGVDPRLDKIVSDTFRNTNGRWKIQSNQQGIKTSYKVYDNVYFELR
jgi:hypothetical protein